MAAMRQQCSICMDSFKNPKLISCHHSYCYKCLDDYVRVNLRNGRFDCPLCRKSVELPKEGVSGFQSNFYIDTDSGEKCANTDSGEKFACDLCRQKKVACSTCLDCKENFCQSCCNAHENSKATMHHKICDLGTLCSEMKGKIRQRIFCDQHPEEEIKLVCQNCKVLICFMCKQVKHDKHDTQLVTDAAAEMKMILQIKVNECLNKLRRIDASKQKTKELHRCIDDAELEELKAVEDQQSRLNNLLDEEVAKVKAKIKNVYHDLRQHNAVLERDVQDEFQTCSNAKDNAQKLADQGTDIEIIQKGPNLEQLIYAAVSKSDQTPNIRLKNKLFSPAKVTPSKLMSLIGKVQDSTDSVLRLRDNEANQDRERRQTDSILFRNIPQTTGFSFSSGFRSPFCGTAVRFGSPQWTSLFKQQQHQSTYLFGQQMKTVFGSWFGHQRKPAGTLGTNPEGDTSFGNNSTSDFGNVQHAGTLGTNPAGDTTFGNNSTSDFGNVQHAGTLGTNPAGDTTFGNNSTSDFGNVQHAGTLGTNPAGDTTFGNNSTSGFGNVQHAGTLGTNPAGDTTFGNNSTSDFGNVQHAGTLGTNPAGDTSFGNNSTSGFGNVQHGGGLGIDPATCTSFATNATPKHLDVGALQEQNISFHVDQDGIKK